MGQIERGLPGITAWRGDETRLTTFPMTNLAYNLQRGSYIYKFSEDTKTRFNVRGRNEGNSDRARKTKGASR